MTALQMTMTSIRQNNYVSFAIMTAVGYDYVLTISNEIEYIWTKPWTCVSTLFLLVRYCGLYTLLYDGVTGTNKTSTGPEKHCGVVATVIYFWVFGCFIGAADLVMILRVWAMYKRSWVILIVLLTLFLPEIISYIVFCVIESIPRSSSVTASVTPKPDLSFCILDATVPPVPMEVTIVLQMAHNTLLFILALVQCARESLQMYRCTNKWQLNRYMDLLVKQGGLYFLAFVLFGLMSLSNMRGPPATEWQMILLTIVGHVPLYTSPPRFIIAMREVYARDGRRGVGIDSAFGLLSSVAMGSEMMYADVERDGVQDVSMEATDVKSQPSY